MSKTVWRGTFTAVLCTAGLALSAQTYPPSQNPSSPDKDKDKGQTVTVTGCIERASQSAIGTSGSASTTGAMESAKFVLTNVTAGTSGTAETPTAAPSPAATTASTYRLDGDDSKLSPHVGHKVEITGRVPSSAASMNPSDERKEANPGAPLAGGASSQANAPKLKVDSVKMISETCPQ
jgi:hypothetical protein